MAAQGLVKSARNRRCNGTRRRVMEHVSHTGQNVQFTIAQMRVQSASVRAGIYDRICFPSEDGCRCHQVTVTLTQCLGSRNHEGCVLRVGPDL